MRQGIKSLFIQEMEERGLTPVIASHNLRELEDVCDHIGVLHKGGIILAKDLIELKGDFLKVQCVLPKEEDEHLKQSLDVIKMTRHGKLLTMTVKGDENFVLPVIEKKNPIYCEALPLTLEEIFISEMEVVGYDIKNLVF
jgi:ABC-2 type transport system ATP-binding protein